MSDEIVDPLAIGAPPEPGVVVVPDPPAPPADPLAGLFFEVTGPGMCHCDGCRQPLPEGSLKYKLPDGVWRCGHCASLAMDPARQAVMDRYRQETGREFSQVTAPLERAHWVRRPA